MKVQPIRNRGAGSAGRLLVAGEEITKERGGGERVPEVEPSLTPLPVGVGSNQATQETDPRCLTLAVVVYVYPN